MKNNLHSKSFSLLKMKEKICIWFLNKFVASDDEFYSYTEPPSEWMRLHNKRVWLQPVDKEEMK